MTMYNTVKYRSAKQEKKTAKEIGGTCTIASGAIWGMKADCRNDKILVECKSTIKEYYSLKVETWEKIKREALRDGMRIPVMRIDLSDIHGDTRSVAVLRLSDYEWYNPNKSYVQLLPVYDKKSFRIKYAERVVAIRKGGILWHKLIIIPWTLFLDYLKEVINCEK